MHGPGGVHAHHAVFDADVGALDLGDVALAGTLAVDCALAEYTLVSCDGADAIGHAPNFGDELLARTRHTPPPPDLEHGRGAPEHVAPALLASAPIVLPAPAPAGATPPPCPPALAPPPRTCDTHDPRGPPRSFAS